MSLPIVIGSGIGALLVGVLVGILGAFLVLRRYFRRKFESERFVGHSSVNEPHGTMFERAPGPNQYRPVPTVTTSGLSSLATSNPSSRTNGMGRISTHYEVEPFTMPDEEGRMAIVGPAVASPTTFAHNTGARVSSHESSVAGPSTVPNQLYVLHHDSQVPPVTILHQDGTRIVELPPRYPPYTAAQSEAFSEARSVSDSRSDGARSDGTDLVLQPRRLGPIQKPPRTP